MGLGSFLFVLPHSEGILRGRILRKEKSEFELSLKGNYQGVICQTRKIGPT